MVMKNSTWLHKFVPRTLLEIQYTPDMFVKCQWQRCAGISVYYLIYRWVIACVFLSVMIASLADVGRPRMDATHYAKWLIYLTHWALTMCTLQALLAAYLVTKARRKQSDKEAEPMKMSPSLRVYWVLHNCATVGAFAITTIYWLFVHNPAENPLDAMNLSVHAGNSVVMFLDLILISHPVRLIDIYWPISFSVVYITFSFIYYLANGTDRKGHKYIYKILNWEEPGRTLVIVQLCVVFLLVLHVSVCTFTVLRCKLATHMRRRRESAAESRARNLQGVANEIPINDLV